MAKPYSMDLRERVVAAVEREGMSCHAAAARYGVAASTAIKWVRRGRARGSVAPGQMGGHRVGILVGHRDWLIERTTRDFTLRGLVTELGERGVRVDYVQVWRFVHGESQPVPAAIDFRLAAAVFAARRRRAMTPMRRLAAISAMSSGS